VSTSDFIEVGSLRIAKSLYDLARSEIAPGTGLNPDEVWKALGSIVEDLGPQNRSLLEARALHERQLDSWYQERVGQVIDAGEYREFLLSTGYLIPEGEEFQVATENVDPEIASIAGPQLVVPVDNARYALNAANARWGSLYDALYGTDVIPEDDGATKDLVYNAVRGARVVAWAERFLDDAVPLAQGSYSEAVEFGLEDGDGGKRLIVRLASGQQTRLAEESKLVGYNDEAGTLNAVVLRNNGLHIEIRIDRRDPIGATHPAGVSDVQLESAVTTIQDCEDSVSAVDAADKVVVYRNWLGIMKGSLEVSFTKGGEPVTRRLDPDRAYHHAGGGTLTLPGRSLLFVRNVGLHMVTDAVTTTAGEAIPEGFLDAMITAFAAVHDVNGSGPVRNSRTGSIYIVKPKLHGPAEVVATVELFKRVEQALELPLRTIKIGIMDEERRTTVNLRECIRAAKDRAVFINTGFLDRTGDEIHTSMQAGPMIPKPEIKSCPWMLAYEDWNVDVGIESGLPGRGQIGKGMWAMPDLMGAMVETKGEHPASGANTAWVPSPTAATLHALHYHRVNVREVQAVTAARPRADLGAILTPPLLGSRRLTDEEIQQELDNNAQGILGYVVRWVAQGIGCSKVADIRDVGLMEDRATLRISSQHMANWLHHSVVTQEQVVATFERMAAVVDRQNAGDPAYVPMAPELQDSIEFQAALDLVLRGRDEPNGYTEAVLHARRRESKALSGGQAAERSAS
jgi:malate synthase